MHHVKQLSFFVPNKLGALQRILAKLDGEPVKICAISILDAADHAVVRLVVNRPAVAMTALTDQGVAVFESELLGIALRPDRPEIGIRRVLAALLAAEVKVEYVYALIVRVANRPILALHVEDPELAGKVLGDLGLDIVSQDELAWEDVR